MYAEHAVPSQQNEVMHPVAPFSACMHYQNIFVRDREREVRTHGGHIPVTNTRSFKLAAVIRIGGGIFFSKTEIF